MTHDQWERGKSLTINNATKEQLKWMVEDRESTIRKLQKENEQLKKELVMFQEFVISKIGILYPAN